MNNGSDKVWFLFLCAWSANINSWVMVQAAVQEQLFVAGLVCTCDGVLSSSSWEMTWGGWFWLRQATIFGHSRYGTMVSLSCVGSMMCWWIILCVVCALVSFFLFSICTLSCMLLLVIVALSFSASWFGRVVATWLKMHANSISFSFLVCPICACASCFRTFISSCDAAMMASAFVYSHCYVLVLEVDYVCHSCAPCLFKPHLEAPIMLSPCSMVVAIGCIAVPCFSGVWFDVY